MLRKSKIFLCSRPVSAYALFFRDTQAAIKGQNPNASFGEVSKIVASMWDALDTEHKNVSFVCVSRSIIGIRHPFYTIVFIKSRSRRTINLFAL